MIRRGSKWNGRRLNREEIECSSNIEEDSGFAVRWSGEWIGSSAFAFPKRSILLDVSVRRWDAGYDDTRGKCTYSQCELTRFAQSYGSPSLTTIMHTDSCSKSIFFFHIKTDWPNKRKTTFFPHYSLRSWSATLTLWSVLPGPRPKPLAADAPGTGTAGFERLLRSTFWRFPSVTENHIIEIQIFESDI